MPKTSSLNKAMTLALTAVLIVSCFAGALIFATGQTTSFPTQPAGSASEIAALEATVGANGWKNGNLQTVYDGIALGETTVAELQKRVDSIDITSTSAAETVFYWYFELSKLGVPINATTIEAALNETAMLPGIGGLPYDYSNTNAGSNVPSFLIYNRYDLYAYQWAAQLGYETSKWNLTLAYTVFNDSVTNNSVGHSQPVLCVESNGQGWGIGYGPRYYDESGETIDMYLTFWLLGIPDALAKAQYWWNWVNANLWDATDYSNGSFYRYALDWTAFECEAGSFDQIISKLYYYNPSIQNVSNLFTDMETRWLNQNWSSPGWLNYVAVHATGVGSGGGNSQERLENTITAWGAMLGFYGNMTSSMQSQVQAMLDGLAGPVPAWSLLFQSELYDNSTGMFSMQSSASPGAQATADAAVLIMLLSTVPVTGALAVPMADSEYEDINNIIDGGVSNMNYANQTVALSVSQPGTFMSMFGTNIFEYDLNSSGVWQLTFSNNWNSITSETLISPLSNSRIYLGTTNVNTETISASSDDHSIINPSGKVNVVYGDNQTFTYSADSGYQISRVLVDGSPVVITGSYTFSNVQAPQNIIISSSQIPIATPTPTPTASPNPTPTPTSSTTPSPTPVPTISQTSSPTPTITHPLSPTPSFSPTINPTPAPTSSPKRDSSPFSVPMPELLGALILVVVILAVSLLLPYIKTRRNTQGEKEKTLLKQ